jgi:hypothetical protein
VLGCSEGQVKKLNGHKSLGRFIAETNLPIIPQAAIDTTKRPILECMGVAFTGSTEPSVEIIIVFI